MADLPLRAAGRASSMQCERDSESAATLCSHQAMRIFFLSFDAGDTALERGRTSSIDINVYIRAVRMCTVIDYCAIRVCYTYAIYIRAIRFCAYRLRNIISIMYHIFRGMFA